MILHDHYRFTAAWRLRIALALKGLPVDRMTLPDGAGAGAPLGLAHSLAMLEALDRRHPQAPLLPRGSFERARMRALAQHIASDTHPLNGFRELNYLRSPSGQDASGAQRWLARCIRLAFESLEAQAPAAGFLGGEAPMLADLVLVPQVHQARHLGVALQRFPRIEALDGRCRALPAFALAAPGGVAPTDRVAA
ncbi:MAG TPA: hypothetical protein VLA56_03085 [Pseudomonadales bacterium]|nr:hypothetical protein [Pseudomonadales bacterium]